MLSYWSAQFLNVTHSANYLAIIAMMNHNYMLAKHLSKYSYFALSEYQHHDYVQAIAVLSMLEVAINNLGRGHGRANVKVF